MFVTGYTACFSSECLEMTKAFLDWHDWQTFVQSDLSQINYPNLADQRQWFSELGMQQFKPAAVLVLVENLKIPQVILTVRSSRLQKHAGQVSFAGGKKDEEDASLIATALRETEEELGVASQQITVYGQLPPLPTISAYEVHPVIGVLNEAVNLKINPDEVETVFRIPLADLMRPENYRPYPIERHQKLFYTVQFPHQHIVWGVTATILLALAQAYENWQMQQSGLDV